MSKNEYGLDCQYFKMKLESIVREVERYTPDEMYRELSRLMSVAAHQACVSNRHHPATEQEEGTDYA